MYRIPIRTNNDSEGFNNRLNSSNSINMNMYRRIDVLYKESILVETVCRVVSFGYVIRRQRNEVKQFEKVLWEKWNTVDNPHSLNKNISKLLNCKNK